MLEARSNGTRRVYAAEQWTEARSLYEGGLSLDTVGKKLGIPYSTIRYHAWLEDWGVRARAHFDSKHQAAKARQFRKRLEREEQRLEQELAITKAQDVEILARKSLAADSARTKLAVSRQVGKILTGLDEDSTISVREKARTLSALTPVIKLLHRWHEEPNLDEMQKAQGAINLRLIATSPEQLRALGEGRKAE